MFPSILTTIPAPKLYFGGKESPSPSERASSDKLTEDERGVVQVLAMLHQDQFEQTAPKPENRQQPDVTQSRQNRQRVVRFSPIEVDKPEAVKPSVHVLAAKRRWQNPEYRQKQLDALARRRAQQNPPAKPELVLTSPARSVESHHSNSKRQRVEVVNRPGQMPRLQEHLPTPAALACQNFLRPMRERSFFTKMFPPNTPPMPYLPAEAVISPLMLMHSVNPFARVVRPAVMPPVPPVAPLTQPKFQVEPILTPYKIYETFEKMLPPQVLPNTRWGMLANPIEAILKQSVGGQAPIETIGIPVDWVHP